MAEKDVVWEHGENKFPGFWCKYCRKQKKGGGATRFKEHLVGRGCDVVHCGHVPAEVREYFRRDLDRIKERKKGRAEEKLRKEYSASHFDMSSDDEIAEAIALSKAEAEFRIRTGERYEHGGGSGTGGGGSGGIKSFIRRASSVTDAMHKNSIQPRIDIGPWSSKGRSAKAAIGSAWSKFFHTSGIPGRRADDPFFVAAVRETQKWGEGVASPTGHEIDGKYLDENERELRKRLEKWKLEWDMYGVTIMCNSWTGPTRMSIINFLLYCNGRMFFHKSMDATGYSQDATYINKEIMSVVYEIGPGYVVQIMTDNGSNYKKACRMVSKEYTHIVWQPYVAHTINLMLKSIGAFREHEATIESVRAISRWLYNHSKLHAMMKSAIGGELVRWNATRFGTNYLFLDSFLRRKEKFMQWMTCSELQQSKYITTEIGRYAHSCICSLPWWDNVKMVVDSVQPLYAFLRFADQDKFPILSEVLLRYNILHQEYASLFQNDQDSLDKYMAVIDLRMRDISHATYMNAAAALNPRTHYAFGTGPSLFQDLREAFEKLTTVDIATEAISEVGTYRMRVGSFAGPLAYKMACDGKTTAAQWWAMFGSSTPILTKLALRLVSQCALSSGCERN